MGTVVNKLKMHMTPTIPKIFDAVFECTLEMINKDFEVFPEHRTNFFFLLQVKKLMENRNKINKVIVEVRTIQ